MSKSESDSSDSTEGTLVVSHDKQKTYVIDEDKQVECVGYRIMGKDMRHNELVSQQESGHSQGTSTSYEVFAGEFHAEKLQVIPKTEENSSDCGKISSDGDSTADDVSTLCDEEVKHEDLAEEEVPAMPNRVTSRFEDRTRKEENEVGTWTPNLKKLARRPQSAGEIKQHPLTSNQTFFRARERRFSEDEDGKAGALFHGSLRKYSSTGDLRPSGRESPSGRRRQLPDLSFFKRHSTSDANDGSSSDSSDHSDNVKVPMPNDRHTLEAQFKLLYTENIRLEKAYRDIQDKVRAESPQILTSRFLSPREAEWQKEKRKLKREVQHLNEKVVELERNAFSNDGNLNVSAGVISPTSEKTEQYFKEKLLNLQKVKDDEIGRLSEQVSYWLKQAEGKQEIKPAPGKEQVARLEQSEAFLQCQITNLEDQLRAAENDLSKAKIENNDLGEHCAKLENCLAVFDAEKSLLDELKQQNGELRKRLAESENETTVLIEKLAQLADENAELEKRAKEKNPTANHDKTELKKKIEELSDENRHLKNERTSLRDRCIGLEDVKECLVQQISTMEEENNSETLKLSEQIKKLNEDIWAIKEDRTNVIESKEQLEVDYELNLNMTENLNKRILDLQSHIETLKSQLDNQKRKITSVNEIQQQLAAVMNEKNDMAALNDKYKDDIEVLQRRLTEQQKHMTESFERASKQLLEETGQMETEQRHLQVENELLRMRSCSRAFDAVVGTKLREEFCAILSDCENALCDVHSTLSKHGINEMPTNKKIMGDTLIEEVDKNFGVEDYEITEEEALDILNEYGEELIGASVEELREMQRQSPRLGDVPSLSQLTASVKENQTILTVLRRINVALSRFSPCVETCEEKYKTNSRISEDLNESSQGFSTESSSRKDAGTIAAEDTEELQRQLSASKISLEQMISNEQAWAEKLNVSRKTCEELSARIHTLQEEKFQLIQSSVGEQRDSGLDKSLNDVKVRLETVERENESLRKEVKTWKNKCFSAEERSTDRICELDEELTRAKASQLSLRKSLDETQHAGEALLKRFEATQKEKVDLVEKHKAEIKTLKESIESKELDLEKAEEKLKTYERNSDLMKGDLTSSIYKIGELEDNLKLQSMALAEIEREKSEYKIENTELKIKLDSFEFEKKKDKDDVLRDVEQLKNSLKQNEQIVEKKDDYIENLNSEIAQLRIEVTEAKSSNEGLMQDLEQKKKLNIEIQSLKMENRRLVEEKEARGLHEDKNANPEPNQNNLTSSDKVRCLEQEIADLKALNSDIKRQNEDALKEKTKLLENLSCKYEEMQMALKDKAKNSISDKENFVSTSKVDSEVIARLQTDLERKCSDLKHATENCEAIKHELSSLSEIKNEILEKNVILANDLSQSNETVISLRRQVALLKSQLDAIQEQASSQFYATEVKNLSANEIPNNSDALSEKDHVTSESIKKCSSPTCQHDKGAMLSELEYLRAKCLTQKQDNTEKSAVRSGKDFRSQVRLRKKPAFKDKNKLTRARKAKCAMEICDAEVEQLHSQESIELSTSMYRGMDGTSSGSDVNSSRSTTSDSDSSESDKSAKETRIRKSDLIEKNQRLHDKIEELQATLENRERNGADDKKVSWLQIENDRLASLLDKAENEACSAQEENDKLREVIAELRFKLSEAEGNNQQSGTESEPEAIYHERLKLWENKNQKELENVKLQLQETECLVVAHKSKLEYIENLNEDLCLSNEKLKKEIEHLERQAKLPKHPIIESIRAELQGQSLSKTAPASIPSEEITTPRDSWTESETLPLHLVVTMLCDKILESEKESAQKQHESEKLLQTLEETQGQLWSVEQRNTQLEREALNTSLLLEESGKDIDDSNTKIKALEDLLSMNEANSKESLRSKEEESEKLHEQLSSMSMELESKSAALQNLDRTRQMQTEEFEVALGEMQSRLLNLTQELENKSRVSEDLLNKTQLLENRNVETVDKLDRKEDEINVLKRKVAEMQQDHDEKVKLAEKSMIASQKITEDLNSTVKVQFDAIELLKDQISSLEENTNHLRETMASREENIANLTGELSEKEEHIGALSARVEKLIQTEEALTTTMNTADDIIAEREKQHIDEVEQLKEGLNKTLSEARFAAMTSEELQNEIVELEDMNKKLRMEIEGMRKEENDVAFQIENMEMERALMDTSLENAREETSELNKNNEELLRENAELNEAIEELQHAVTKLNSQVAEVQEQCDAYAHDVKEKELEIDHLKDEILQSRKQLECKLPAESLSTLQFRVKKNEDKSVENELEEARHQISQMHGLIEKLRIDKINLEEEVRRIHEDFHHHHMSLFSPKEPAIQEETEISSTQEFVGDASQRTLPDDQFPDSSVGQLSAHYQEESLSLRSENEALRSKIASLEGSISEMAERLVPKLELGSIADESDAKHKVGHINDDDTGRYVDDIETTRATFASKVEMLEEKLKLSEESGAKLLMQIQEMEEEALLLRNNVQDLSDKNDTIRLELFGTISEEFQTQIDELSSANVSMKTVLEQKDDKLNELRRDLKDISSSESQWRRRYKEVQGVAEELRQQLQQAEDDNLDLQRRLMDLDMECRNMIQQEHGHSEAPGHEEMKQTTCDAYSQTLSIRQLLHAIKEGRKNKQNIEENGKSDTDNDVSDIVSSSSSSSTTSNEAVIDPVGGSSHITNLAEDELLLQTIINDRSQVKEDGFNKEDIPDPVTESLAEPSLSVDQTSVSNTTMKSLQNELLGYQLMVEKLKRRNQELLEGSGAAMSQDDKESLEREVSALRGQVALLERNNRIFSDRERTELKQDLEMANKRCSNYQAQLQAVKASLDYAEVEKIKKQLSDLTKEADELKEKLQEYEDEDTSDSDSHSSDGKSKKYARLLELEEEGEELKTKIEERDEDIKDRDVMIEELQHQLKNVKEQYAEELEQLEKQKVATEKKLQEEVKEKEREVSEKNEMLKLKKNRLNSKSEELEDRDVEIEKLQKEIQKKGKEIEQLRWELESMQRENLSLKNRIERLKEAISSSSDPRLLEATMSPVATLQSPSTGSLPSRSRSRTSTPKSSFHSSPDGRRSNRSTDSIGTPYITAFNDHHNFARPRRAVSLDVGFESPTNALREGIQDAKETVHQMGDVLDTPRMSPSRRMSPIPKSERAATPNLSSTTSFPADLGSPTRSASHILPQKEGNIKKSENNISSLHNKISSISTSISEDESTDGELDSYHKRGQQNSSDLTLQLHSPTHVVEDEVIPFQKQIKPNNAENFETADGIIKHPSRSSQSKPSTTSRSSSTSTEEIASISTGKDCFQDKHRLSSFDTDKPEVYVGGEPQQNTGELPSSKLSQSKKQIFIPTSKEPYVEATLQSEPLLGIDPALIAETDGHVPVRPTADELSISFHADEPNQSQIQDSTAVKTVPLLPDDRPTLIREVAKAREEARKWFSEVTEADREKRLLARRLDALENELVRLKGVENNYELLKKHQEDAKRVQHDLALVRAQADAAARKAEEARERNALLRAHLLDKEEVENENKELKRNVEKMRRKNEESNANNSSKPLSELQEVVSTPTQSPPKMITSPHDKQLNEIKDSFEYIASNFADLVLRKHDAEVKLAPQQAKVSRLKRKCLERDQLLAKFVLRSRKKKPGAHTDENASDSCSESVASSTGFTSLLSEANRAIKSDVLDEETSGQEDFSPKKNRMTSGVINNVEKSSDSSFLSPPRPPSALLRSLSAKSPHTSLSSPTHRIYIAKHDYAPSSRSTSPNNNNNIPITHSLLPDLPLLSGDTVVAIGSPDQREDGKMYQMAEVRGKIGFVPLGHLVAAEQVEGMQAFVQERGKTDRKRSATSSPEKIVNLYKKLEQAHLMVSDKMERNAKGRSPTKPKYGQSDTDTGSFLSHGYKSTNGYATSQMSDHIPGTRRKERRTSNIKLGEKSPKEKSEKESESFSSGKSKEQTKPRPTNRSKSSSTKSKRSSNDSNRRVEQDVDNRYINDKPFIPVFSHKEGEMVRSSTPIYSNHQQHRRSSSLPPKRESSTRSSRSELSTPGNFVSSNKSNESSPRKTRSRSSSRRKVKHPESDSSFRSVDSLNDSNSISVPQPPTFLVIEKTMGQKSMIIRWTPPLLDMISRSNNLPVIGYEISVEKQRKMQVSGAYTNKAILGDLDLTNTQTIEIRTVSSIGTLSTPCEVIFTPHMNSSVTQEKTHSPPSLNKLTPSPRPTNQKNKDLSKGSPIQKATALYDYDPVVDSPYKTPYDEVNLQQGDEVIIVGSPRPDGFCDVQVQGRRGFAPIAFLISDCDETIDSSEMSLKRHNGEKSRQKRRTKSKDRLHRYASSSSSFQN